MISTSLVHLGVGASIESRDMLELQDCLYTLSERDFQQ
jgi:hypothetical protein